MIKTGVKLPVGASPPAYGVTPTQNLSQTLPQRVPCAVCGRLFGSRSIKIHEPQCIKKAETQGKSQRVDCSLARKNFSVTDTSQISKEYRPTSTGESNKRPPIFPCYLCGELFSVHSIAIHEPQCLKKWRIENDKLPPHKRRPEPVKEEFKYTDDGKLDLDATCEAMWRSHLSQLVPCKYCSRTFNPDRVAVHERSCKGKA